MWVIGITGTLGAGKGTIVDYLVRNKSFTHYSVRDFLIAEIERRHLVVNRDSMTQLANQLREAYGPSYIVDCLYDQAKAIGNHCVIESIRNLSEIESLRKKGRFVLLAIDADPAIRYARIKERKSATDAVSFETFLADETREMQSNDPNHQNLAACIRQADYILTNNGSIEELHQQIDQIITKILIL